MVLALQKCLVEKNLKQWALCWGRIVEHTWRAFLSYCDEIDQKEGLLKATGWGIAKMLR